MSDRMYYVDNNNNFAHVFPDTKEITPEQIRAIEDEVNARIRENVPVYVDVVSLDDPKLQTVYHNFINRNYVSYINLLTN